jgi:ankyrin repeat protein
MISHRFQWVFCHLETLRRALPPKVRSILESLPECLDKTYEEILKGICKANQGITHRLLQCLVVAVHPLRIEELAEVIAVDFDAKGTPPMLNPGLRCPDQEDADYAVMSACSSLVNVVNDGDSRIVQFSHYSVKEYLMSDRFAESNSEVSCYHIRLEPAHTILAQACLGVLLQLDRDVNRDSIQNFPLARYAAQYWVKHAQFGNVASSIEDGMYDLFDADKPHFSTWLWVYDDDDHSSTPGMRPSNSKPVPLYHAALFGFRDLARRLLEIHPEYMNAQGGYHGTPLHAATSRGHVDLSSLLIDHLPDVDIRGIWDQTPLHRAAREGYLEIGQQLVSRRANVNSQDDEGWTPLHSAAFRGRVEFAQMLLEHGAAVNATSNDGRSPLHLASIRGQVEVIRLLLKHDADRHARDNNGRTPCEIASESGHKNGEIVQLLSQAETGCGAGTVQKLVSTHHHYDALSVGNYTATGGIKKSMSAHRYYGV